MFHFCISIFVTTFLFNVQSLSQIVCNFLLIPLITIEICKWFYSLNCQQPKQAKLNNETLLWNVVWITSSWRLFYHYASTRIVHGRSWQHVYRLVNMMSYGFIESLKVNSQITQSPLKPKRNSWENTIILTHHLRIPAASLLNAVGNHSTNRNYVHFLLWTHTFMNGKSEPFVHLTVSRKWTRIISIKHYHWSPTVSLNPREHAICGLLHVKGLF